LSGTSENARLVTLGVRASGVVARGHDWVTVA